MLLLFNRYPSVQMQRDAQPKWIMSTVHMNIVFTAKSESTYVLQFGVYSFFVFYKPLCTSR
jgi:hypothetical protein